MKTPENPYLLGQIAIREGLVQSQQLAECLNRQAQAEVDKPLGWYLVDAGHLTEAQLAQVLSIQESRFEKLSADPSCGGLFGQIAVRLGYVSRPQIHEALREQQAVGRGESSLLLGQILLRKKHLTPDQFLEILRRQKKDATAPSQRQA
jgi:hypothetical protein